MSENSFKAGLAYPVLFMTALSLVFVGILAAMYRISEPKIERQKREQYELAILGLSAAEIAQAEGSSAEDILNNYPESFSKYITIMPEGSFTRPAYAVVKDGATLSYVFDIVGKGLWGTMRALVATNPTADTILALTVYEQVETPGLGARISEDWFRDQFRGKAVIQDGAAVKYELIPEKQPPATPNQINKVTGATITTNAVLSMLRTELLEIHSILQQREGS